MLNKVKLIIAIFLIGLNLITSCNQVNNNVKSKVNFADAPDTFNYRATVGLQDDSTYVVATSQIINPAGNTVIFPGRPTDLALNNAESILAVKNKSDLRGVLIPSTGRPSIISEAALAQMPKYDLDWIYSIDFKSVQKVTIFLRACGFRTQFRSLYLRYCKFISRLRYRALVRRDCNSRFTPSRFLEIGSDKFAGQTGSAQRRVWFDPGTFIWGDAF